MTSQEILKLKSQIFVYHIIPFDSLGIYLAENKEDALKSISKDIWEDLNPAFIEKAKPFNIYESIEIWTWDEYQKDQGFRVTDRLLEICC